MHKLTLLTVAVAALLLVACDSGTGDEGGTADVSSGSPDAITVPDVAEGCTPECDASLCMVCQEGECVSTCKADEECVEGQCQTVEQPCEPDCGPCETCTEGECVNECTGEEQCHDGTCEVPPGECEDCEPCEVCDSTDIWAPVCVSECTGEEQCHDGTCEVPPACNPECDADACETCDDSDIWAPTCVGTCDTLHCQGCDGEGNCVGQCVAADCEACDGEGNCATTCDTDACQTCDGAGSCVDACSADACEACDGMGVCGSTCTEEQYCDAGQCVERPELTCEDDDGFCPGSVASVLEVAEAPDTAGLDACCCDLNGDGKVDNKLGELLELITPLTGYDRDYFNESIARMIEYGHLLYLFEPLGVDDTTTDPYVKFHVYEGVDGDDWYYNNLTGGAEFYVSRESLDRDGNPLMVFDDSQVSGGRLHGGPSRFVVPIDLIGAGEPIIMMMEGTYVAGDITAASVGYDVTNGTVCGYVERTKIISEVNEYTGINCGCLNLTGDFFSDGGSSVSCGTAAFPSTCDTTDSVENLCQELFDNCGMITLLMPALFDVDANGDGTDDAMSVGFEFEAVSADLIGLEPEEQL